MSYCLNLLVFYANPLQKHNIAKELYLILKKLIFLWVSLQQKLFQLVENSSNGIEMICFVDVDQNVIQVYNDKNVQLFGQNLVDIPLNTGQRIDQVKSHDLALEIALFSLECCLLFINFLNWHPMVHISQFEHGETLGPTQLIQRLANP